MLLRLSQFRLWTESASRMQMSTDSHFACYSGFASENPSMTASARRSVYHWQLLCNLGSATSSESAYRSE